MKHQTVRNYFLRDKTFLKELFENPNPLKNNRTLINATDSQLNTLLFYLHYLSIGDIKITKPNFEELVKLKKITLIKSKIEKKKLLSKLLNGPRSEKLVFLKKLSAVMHNLLHSLFHLP